MNTLKIDRDRMARRIENSARMLRLPLALVLFVFANSAAYGDETLWSTGKATVDGVRSVEINRKAFTDQIKKSGAITIDAWILPDNLKQEGPARILTFSNNTSERNFTLGQEGDRIEVRLRTDRGSKNGTPGLVTKAGSLKKEWTHVVFTRDQDGKAQIFLNGNLAASRAIPGDFTNWKDDYTFQIGDEVGGSRPWKGEIRSLAVFAESEGGPKEKPKPEPVKKVDPNRHRFETQVTTILTQHCLECHDSATAKGDLDLSKRSASHSADGILIAGKAADSLLWESIESDDMPKKRDPSSHASCGDFPWRINSTIRKLPTVLTTSSPTPVAVAPPTSLSTKSPAPIIGESPTLPAILYAIPLVVHAPAMSPSASMANMPMVS